MSEPTLSLLTIDEAAERTGISARTMRHACAKKLVPSTRVGKKSYLIRPADADFFAANRPKSGPKPKAKKGLRKPKKSRKTT